MSVPASDPPVVLWQYRWTNPLGDIDASADQLAWREVVPEAGSTVSARRRELAAYSCRGRPCYELRALIVAEGLPHD